MNNITKKETKWEKAGFTSKEEWKQSIRERQIEENKRRWYKKTQAYRDELELKRLNKRLSTNKRKKSIDHVPVCIQNKIEADARREYKKTPEYREYLKNKKEAYLISLKEARKAERTAKRSKLAEKKLALAKTIMESYEGECKFMDENPSFVIFDDGKIWNINKQKYLGTSNHRCGYLLCNAKFMVNGEPKQMLLHRIVALNFIPNPDNLPEVNHKNFNKTDCAVQNLEWVNKTDNMSHYWDIADRSQRYDNPFKAKPVVQYTLNDEFIAEYPSIYQAAKHTNSSYQCVREALNGRLKTSNGFKWAYKNEENLENISIAC